MKGTKLLSFGPDLLAWCPCVAVDSLSCGKTVSGYNTPICIRVLMTSHADCSRHIPVQEMYPISKGPSFFFLQDLTTLSKEAMCPSKNNDPPQTSSQIEVDLRRTRKSMGGGLGRRLLA